MKKLICFLLSITIIISCTKNKENIDDVNTDKILVNIKINRFERDLFKNKTPEAVYKFIEQNKTIASTFFQMPLETENDKQRLAKHILNLVNHPSLDSIYQASERVFGDMQDIEAQFTEGYKHIKYYYPKFKEPQINTIVTGFSHDKLINDSSITIGLDYFLGKEINYAPPVFEYLKSRLSKPYFVHNIMLETSGQFIEIDPNDETLLSNMIAWGKALYFTHKVMPSLPDSIILGYTNKQLLGAKSHEAIIFNHFVKENLLFSSSHTNDKYVTERPYTAEIGSECPPRIGRWMGYLIVSKYMENNPKLTLPDLMKEKDAKKIFTQSKYKPKK